jgi:hypothetical protein
MTLNSKQLKQIIQYKASRMYFGEWQPSRIDDAFRDTSGGTQPEELFIGELTEDIICDVLWYEMSYNPLRFGSFSPFKKDGKNSILHFLDTYRKLAPREPDGLLAHGVITLVWQIDDFIKNLKKADLYEGFAKNGKLPPILSILGADENYHVLTTLRKAIHTIAKQNGADLKDPAYREQIEKIAAQRHPTGNRSDISYMSVKLEDVIQQKIATMETKTVETKKPEIKSPETKQAEPQTPSKQEVIQTCLPFFDEEEKIDKLTIIREKIVQKQNEIAAIEQNIKDMREIGYTDLEELYRQLKHARQQYAGLCTQEMRLLKKAQNEKSNGKSR